ncbi:MAG TPA: arylsulfotransferase family protein [Candidatus Limnocylindrales bacterium]
MTERDPVVSRDLWTRRRFLVGLGTFALAGASVGGLAEIATASRRGLDAAATPTAGAPARHAFRSRPDLTPPVVTIAGPRDRGTGLYTFLTPANGAAPDGPTIVDRVGELTWMRPSTAGIQATDLHVVDYGDRPALAWWQGGLNSGIGLGEFVVVDEAYRPAGRISAGNGRQADLHELQLTSRGTALLFADTPLSGAVFGHPTPTPWPVMDCAVQEIDLATGRVVFEWRATEHIGLDESYIDPPTQPGKIYDYVHGNAIEEDTDGNLLVSARNTSAIYKVDRATGDILWRLGGKRSDFRVAHDASFGWQHDVRRRFDGTLTLFDNGAAAAPGRSRGLRIALDEVAGTVSLVASYDHPDRLLATSQGNVQLLADGGVFVGWGSRPFFSEYEDQGTLLVDATFPAAVQSYRDYRQAWTGRPADQPAVAVRPGPGTGSGGTVYASWNGATGIATWRVLSGDAVSDLRVVMTAPRTGFETAIPVASLGRYVAVRAHDELGGALGTSVPVLAGTVS